MNYRSELDGLRAVAVISVILFHAGFEIFSGGFVGVDVFFVISGYLITTILIEEISNNQFSIENFYERRARRILPALFFIIIFCILFAWIWMRPAHMNDFSQSLVAVSVFSSNILFWSEGGYLVPGNVEKPLYHTWSLAVSEQFYLVFPIFLITIWNFGRKKVFWLILLISVISLLISEWGWRNTPNANFFLVLTRAWELLTGSLVAFMIYYKSIKNNNFLALIGLVAIIFSVFAYDISTPIPSVHILVPVLGTVMIILYAKKNTLVTDLLSTKFMVGIGLISYSAYLWHFPLMSFAKIKLLNPPDKFLMLSLSFISFIIAFISWKFIEKPFRNRERISRKFFISFSLVGILFFSVIGILGHFSEGFRYRFSTLVNGDTGHIPYYKYIDQKYFDCEPKSIASNALSWNEFLRCKQSRQGEPDWLIIGDSHAEHLFLGLADENPDINIVYYIFGTAPYLGNKDFHNIFEVIADIEDSKTILLTMHYNHKVSKDNVDGFETGYRNTIKYLKNLGHQVILVGSIPEHLANADNCKFGRNLIEVYNFCSTSIQDFQLQKNKYEPTIRELSLEFDIPFISIYEPLCDSSRCNMIIDETLLYRHNSHLNIPGSILIGSYLTQKIREIEYFN